MKNNRITFVQFCFLSAVSVIIAILFIDSSASLFQPLLCAAALGVDALFICLYKGSDSKLLRLSACVYAGLAALASSYFFIRYICDALGYGPCALIAVILFGFSFFCTVKGIEAAARASLIVGAVVLVSMVYITLSVAPMLDLRFTLQPVFSPAASLILLFPSAAYILLYDNIIPKKKYNFAFFAVCIVAVVVLFTLAASGRAEIFPVRVLPSIARIDIFRGSDGLLLTVLTLSVVYINTVSTLSTLKNRRHNYLANSVYLTILTAAAILSLAVSA